MTLIAMTAQAEDRLRIEVLPVYITPTGTFGSIGAARPDNFDSTRQSTNIFHEAAALRAVREAMTILRVDASDYDIVLSTAGPLSASFDYLECTYGQPDIPTQCTHPIKGAFTAEQMLTLYRSMEYESPQGEPTKRQPGTIFVMVLVMNERFPWDGGVLGRSNSITWTNFDPQDMHWSTMACSVWSHLHVSTLAHELGHCFGLDHNGAGDANFDGTDNTVDLMAASWAAFHTPRLKPSNQARVERHFRRLEEPASMSRAPLSRQQF